MKKYLIGLALFLPCLAFAISYDSGNPSAGGAATFTTATVSTGTISVLNVTSGTVTANQWTATKDIILGTEGSGLKQIGASGVVSYILRRDTDDRLYLNSRDQTLRLTTGGSGLTAVELDTNQNTLLSGSLGLLANATPRTSVTPPQAGSLIFNSTDSQLCMSTGTTASTWVIAGTTGTQCNH